MKFVESSSYNTIEGDSVTSQIQSSRCTAPPSKQLIIKRWTIQKTWCMLRKFIYMQSGHLEACGTGMALFLFAVNVLFIRAIKSTL